MQAWKNPALCGIRDDVSPTDVSPNENSCIYCPLYYLSLAQIIPENICQGRNVQGTWCPWAASYKGKLSKGRNVLRHFVSGHIGRGHTVTSFVTSIINIQFTYTIVPKLLTSSSVYAVETRHVSRNRGDLQIYFMNRDRPLCTLQISAEF